jgi:hypothetical protein
MIPLPAIIPAARAALSAVPWRAIGIFAGVVLVAGLVLRGNHHADQAKKERDNAVRWETIAGQVVEIANENARIAGQAQKQAAAAGERAAEIEKKRKAAERTAAALKERVSRESQGLASPGVRAAIDGLRQ